MFRYGFLYFFYDKESKTYEKKVFNSTFWILVGTSLIPIFIILFSKQLAGILFKDSNKNKVIILSLFTISSSILTVIPNARIRIVNKMKIFAIINVGTSLISIILNILFIVKFRLGYYSLIITILINNLIQMISYFYIVRDEISIKYFDRKLIKHILKYTIPLIPATVSSWVIDLSDRYIINHFFSSSEVGIYAIANKIVIILTVFSSAFMTSYPSFVFSNAKQKDAKDKFGKILNYYFLIFCILSIIITVFSKEIVMLMSQRTYWMSYKMVGFLTFGNFAFGMAFLVGSGMSIAKKSTYSMMISWISAIVNIILNMILIPKYGAVIAAITTMISYLIVFVLNYYFSQKFYHCNYNIITILIMYFVIFILCSLTMTKALVIKLPMATMIILFLCLIFKNESNNIIKFIRNTMKNFLGVENNE